MKKVIAYALMGMGALYTLEIVAYVVRKSQKPTSKVTQLPRFNLPKGDPGKLETEETFKGWSIGGYL